MIFNIKIKERDRQDEYIIQNINSTLLDESDVPENPKEIYGFDFKLNIYRNKIDKINTDVWKKIRWYINDYDFLVKDPIINRAFYKYWEIINVFNIFQGYNDNDIIFHCAEAPGGFIQGSNIYLQLNDTLPCYKLKEKDIDNDGFTMVSKKKKIEKKYKIFTISLNKDLPEYKSYNLPSYNKRVINKHVYVTYGKDNTGDINNLDNINNIKPMVNTGCYLVTADGGFDEGTDFNNKEQLHYLLILNEIYSAICLQKNTGSFILKVFDIFTETSIHLLYLLNLVYTEVYIYKPKTSRPTNSEKYIICKNFILNEDIKNVLLKKLYNLSNNIKVKEYKYNSFKLFDKIPDLFIKNIHRMNTLLLNNQCKYLHQAVELCEDPTFTQKYEIELEKSLDNRKRIFKQWEAKYNLNYYIPSS